MVNTAQTPRPEQYPRRLHDLERRFVALCRELKESPQKEALSILHGITQELWRQLRRSTSPLSERGLTIDDIADLYRHAPKMEGAAARSPLRPGTPAPDFALPDASGRIIRLSDLRGQPIVLAFYPLDWSPACSQQLDLYQQEREEFERRGAKVLAISVDSIYSHGAWASVRRITFPLLADFSPKGEVATQYEVYREQEGFSERALYVLDGEGVIRYSHVSPFLHHIPDIYVLFNVLDSLKGETRAPLEASA